MIWVLLNIFNYVKYFFFWCMMFLKEKLIFYKCIWENKFIMVKVVNFE